MAFLGASREGQRGRAANGDSETARETESLPVSSRGSDDRRLTVGVYRQIVAAKDETPNKICLDTNRG